MQHIFIVWVKFGIVIKKPTMYGLKDAHLNIFQKNLKNNINTVQIQI